MNLNYQRVIPRDLFNESKLLKCIGRLTLLIHEGKGINGMKFEESHEGERFKIGLLYDGYLAIHNISFLLGNRVLSFKCLYNSKDNYPLYLMYDYSEYLVFDEDGNYTEEFTDACKQISLPK